MTSSKKEKETRALIPSRPFSEMTGWQRDIERMFDDFFWKRVSPLWSERWWPSREIGFSVPPIDLYEKKDEIIAKVELPGLEKDEVQVNITDNLLTIKGEKKREEEIEEEDYYRAERSYGSFSRSVDLPKEVQVEKARASFKNGILEVRLPKSDEAKKKETKVKVD